MSRVLAMLLLTFLFAQGSRAQDQAPEPAAAENAGTDDAAAPADADAEADKSDTPDEDGPAVDLDEAPELDRQTHEKDDDEFIPTEEIPVDQSIPFPTDI